MMLEKYKLLLRMADPDSFLQDLERHEGWHAAPYKDTEGFWTVGVGHLVHWTDETCTALQEQDGLNDKDIGAFLVRDAAQAVDNATAIYAFVDSDSDEFFDFLSKERQNALANMAFNLGYQPS